MLQKHGLAKSILFLLFALTTKSAYSGILGSFAKVENLPGFIDLDPHSPWYKGVLDRPSVQDGIERRTPSQLVNAYFTNERLDLTKMRALIDQVADMKRNAFIAFCMEKLPKDAPDNHYCLGEVSDEKLLRKWEKKETNVVLQFVISELNHAIDYGRNILLRNINTPQSEPFLNSFFAALNIIETVKGEDYQRGKHAGANRIVDYNINNLFVNINYTVKNDRFEAANLLVPPQLRHQYPGKQFFALRDLERLQRQGYDISALDPIESGLWRKPTTAIRNYDTTRYNGESLPNLTRAMGAEDAEKLLDSKELIDVVYMPEKFGSGATPKLYGKIGDAKWKVKYLTDKVGRLNTTNLMNVIEMLLNSAEVNVENAVNNLAAAVGFTVDPTYYKQKLRLFFPEEIYAEERFDEAYEDMIRLIEESFGKNMYVRSAMQNIKVDEATGRKYIELRGVNLERKGDRESDMNIGLFERHGLGRSLQREHRAFSLFLAWIGDIDPKNENVRLKLIPVTNAAGEPTYKIAYSNSDMGAGLGVGLPNYLPREFVTDAKFDDKGRTKSFTFEYRKIYPLPIMEAVTLDDARWLARRIGQFTNEQLYDTFLAAGFPELIAKVFAQKMMGRRNQLLEALGMIGRTVTDDEGRPLVLERGEEFAGSIPGYERYFKDGLVTDENNELFDPERENFPRYWGTYWNKQAKDKPQTIFWRHMGLRLLNQSTFMLMNFLEPGAYLTGAGPSFTGLSLYRTSPLLGTCSGNCFFQGVGLGVGTFAPFRFIVDNPDKSSDEPFLIVDLFRIGLSVGGVNRNVEEALGLDIPIGSGLAVGGRAFKIYEFMKIRAVRDIDEYVSGYKESLKKTPRLMFEKAKQQFIESMEPGDSMILSTYVGLQGRVRYAPLIDLALISPQIKLKGESAVVSRVTLHKQGEDTMLANWAKLNLQRGEMEAGMRLGLRVDLASWESLRKKQRESTFGFDLNQAPEKDYLMKHLHAYYPKDIPESYNISEREKRIKQNRVDAGFFALVQHNHIMRRIEVDLHDYLTRTTTKELSYEKVYLNSYMKGFNVRSRAYTFKASVNEAIDPFVKVKLEIALPEAKEKHFLKTLNRIAPLVSDDFIVFDPLAVKEYMGTLSFLGTTIFPRESLDELFAHKPADLCEAFVSVNPFPMGGDYCHGESYTHDHGLRSFMRDFAVAKRSYYDLRRMQGYPPFALHSQRDRIFGLLRDFVDLFTRHNDRHNIVKVFKQLLPKTSYYQQAKLHSSLNGFPLDDDEIEISRPNQGSFEPHIRHIAETPEEVYQLFSDALHFRVQPFFYNPVPSLSLGI